MKRVKQIVAIIAIILLLALYIATFCVAIFSEVGNARPFAMCLFGSVAIPLLAFIFIWVYGKTYGKGIIGDPDNPYVSDNSNISNDSITPDDVITSDNSDPTEDNNN